MTLIELLDYWHHSTRLIFNGALLMTSWPVAFGVYFPIALKEGGTRRLWKDAINLMLVVTVFALLWPVTYIVSAPYPACSLGFDSFTLPISVLFSAGATGLVGDLSKSLLLQIVASVLVAVFVAVSATWIT